MYDELVKRLRNLSGTDNIAEYDEAADAIEELSRIERDFRQYVSDQVKREKGVYACCYCKNRKSASKAEYIERKDAIALLSCFTEKDSLGFTPKEIVKHLPAADVIPAVHGRWREVENGESGRLCECSACKEWLLFYYGFVANYCPNCGAGMDQ